MKKERRITMRKKIFSWLAMFMVCLLLGGMLTPIANAAVAEQSVVPPEHDGYIALSQYVQHMEDNIFKVQLTLEPYAKSTTADIVMVIDTSENMLLRTESVTGKPKTYFENALDAVHRTAEIWLNPGKNPLDSKSTDKNRLFIVFYNGRAYDMKADVIDTGTKNSSTYCYISDQAYTNPKTRAFAGKTAGIVYRPFGDLRKDLNSIINGIKGDTTDITLQPGAFNNDLKAYQERYTAAGLAAAYDIFADYSKTEDIKTESNRKILYLLSNGPDYERDNVHLNGAGVASMSSSRVPQEGSMRMEALFMAKALKLQMHSYGTGTETSLKTAADQIAKSEGNSYKNGVIQAPSSGTATTPAYSPLSLDAHRVVIDPPDLPATGPAGVQTRYLDSTAVGSGVMESGSFGGAAAVDDHPYNGTAYEGVNGPYSESTPNPYPTSPISAGSSTDPIYLVNRWINANGGSADITPGTVYDRNKGNSGLNQLGVVTNVYNGTWVPNGGLNPTQGDPPLPSQLPPIFPNAGNQTGAWGAGAFNGKGHFEYQMFANTAPYQQGDQARVAADGNLKPTSFSSLHYYLSALNSSPIPPANAFRVEFTNTHDRPFTSPMDGAGGTNRRPLDGYNYPFIPTDAAGNTTSNTYVYTYADAVGGANVGVRPTTIPTPNVGPDNTIPLKKTYERIAGTGFPSQESGGMSVEIWSVGLFAGDQGDPEGDPSKAKGPTALGQGKGNRMYSMGTGYGTLDKTITAADTDYRWEQETDITPPPLTSKKQYHTDYTGYTYGHHTRPTHIDLHSISGQSLTTSGGGNYAVNYTTGYSTGPAALQPTGTAVDVYTPNYQPRENQEVSLFENQGRNLRIDVTGIVTWYTGTASTSTWGGSWNHLAQWVYPGSYNPNPPRFGVTGYQYPTNPFISGPTTVGNTTTTNYGGSNTTANWVNPSAANNGYGAAFSYIPPNPDRPSTAKNIQAHYSPNISAATGVTPGNSSTMLLNPRNGGLYKSEGNGGRSGAASVTWFDLIDWHETTGATGTTTQNDDSKGDITGNYTTPNLRHNIWSVATESATMPINGPGSIPRDQVIYNGTGVNITNRSELQQHLWAISGVQTSKTVGTLNDPSGFDPNKPWHNSVAYYWSKQTFLTTARMRLDDTIERVELSSQTTYGNPPDYTKYPFVDPGDITHGSYHPTPGATTGSTNPTYGFAQSHTLHSTVTWRYPWTNETVNNEGSNSINRDFQNFYEYAGFNYNFGGYQIALDQILGSLRYVNTLEKYDEEDHMPIVKMLHKKAPYTGKNSIYDTDPDELDQYDRLVRVFEDLTFDFYRVSSKGGRAVVQLSEYFDLYKMPGIPEFEYYVNAAVFPWRYRNKMGGTASYNSGDKKVTWTFDQGIYAGCRYQLSFYVRMNRETDPKQKYPFQVHSYLDQFNFRSMIRYSGKENHNRYIITKNFPSSFVYGIKGINDIASNVVIMNDYTPNTIDGSGSVLSSMGDGSGPSSAVVGAFPEGGGAAAALQKTVPIYTASVTPAPKKLIDEGVDEGNEEVPVTGIFGVVAVVVVSGLLLVAIVIKRRSTIDR